MRLEDSEKLAGLTTVQNALLQITEWPCQDQQYDVTRHGFDVGLVNGSEGVRLSNVDIEMPHLVKGLIDMCRCAIESAGDILKFNSIRVDWNYTQRRLTKRGQRGLSASAGNAAVLAGREGRRPRSRWRGQGGQRWGLSGGE